MQRLVLLLVFISSMSLWANKALELYEATQSKALKTNYVAFNVVDRLKPLDGEYFFSDTIYVLAKRNGFVPKLNALFRFQYKNGNVNLFNGKEYKSLDTDEKTLFTVDTSNGAFKYIDILAVPLILNKHLATEYNKLDFTGYNYKMLGDTTLDGKLCNQIAVYTHRKRNMGQLNGKIFYSTSDSAVFVIGKPDNLVRRFYRKVQFENGQSQIEEQLFSNVRAGVPIDDIMFDISLPSGYSQKISSTANNSQPQLLAIGSDAPKWVLGDENDVEYRLSDYKGKVVILDFWGTWCKWCLKSMPKIEEIHRMYKDKGVVVLGISCQEPHTANPTEFMKKKGFTYKCLVQGDEVANHYKVKGFPTLYVIDKYGKVAWYFVGYSENLKEMLGQVIERELAR